MTSKSNLFIALLTFIGCFVLLALRPVPAVAVQNVKSITGKIVRVSADGDSGNVIIQLKNNDRTFYISRRTQNRLPLETLKNNLLYRQATLDFVGHWTSMDPISKVIPVARVSVSGQTYWHQPTAKFVSNKID